MKALFISKNLLGDGLWIGWALREWQRAHPGATVVVLTNGDWIAPIYERMGLTPPFEVVTDSAIEGSEFDFRHTFDCGAAFKLALQKNIHMATAYAELLGVPVPPSKAHLRPRFDVYEDDLADVPTTRVPGGIVVLSPFSHSCSSRTGGPPNKMLPWDLWRQILWMFRVRGYVVRVMGGRTDRAPMLDLAENEYICGWPLPKVAGILRSRVAMIVGVDNGLAHLAASQGIPQLLFYPACLPQEWIVPWGNPNLFLVQMDPNRLDGGQLLTVVRHLLPMWPSRARVG